MLPALPKSPAPVSPRWMAALGIVGLLCHVLFWPIITVDVVVYYIPWLDTIVARGGGLQAFAEPFANYTPPYLYLLALAAPLKGLLPDPYIIKTVSVVCNLLLVAALWHVLRALKAPAPHVALLALALPSVMMNAALLGQCDALYAAPCVMAVGAALTGRHRAMMAWAGLALSVKAQAILGAPFVLAAIIAWRVPVRDWLFAPLGFVAAFVPALLAGWPLTDMLSIYLRQADTFHDIARNAPNIWMIAQTLGATATVSGLATALAVGVCGAYIAWFGATLRQRTVEMQLRAALLAPMLAAGLLPKMHERYFFLADVLAFAWAMLAPGRDSWRIMAYVQLGSAVAAWGYLTGANLAVLAAVPMMLATWMTARPLIMPAANDNPLLPRRAV